MKHYFALCRYRKAQLALQKGEEDLAREALKRRKTYAVSSMFLKETMWCLNLSISSFCFAPCTSVLQSNNDTWTKGLLVSNKVNNAKCYCVGIQALLHCCQKEMEKESEKRKNLFS
jgi:hypothetical protein